METSDYGITQGTVDKDDLTTRGAHTHHILMTDGVIGTPTDWMTSCPKFNPVVTGGFVVTGTAFVTGNGSPAGSPPFGPSPLTVCILGGSNVKYSNFTMAIGPKASGHFGTQAIHGVVLKCAGALGAPIERLQRGRVAATTRSSAAQPSQIALAAPDFHRLTLKQRRD